MKKLIKLLSILFLFSGFTSTLNGQSLVKNEEDEFTGNRVIQSEYIRIEHEGFSGRSYIGAFYNEGTYMMLLTVASRDSWQLLSADDADFLIDGERESYDLHRIDTEVSSGTTSERYAFILSESEFKRFSEAEEVKFRANRNIYTLNSEAKKAFSLILDSLEEEYQTD